MCRPSGNLQANRHIYHLVKVMLAMEASEVMKASQLTEQVPSLNTITHNHPEREIGRDNAK